ncbi:MAG: hypothetical protein R3C03_05505 [Pirellulaceae bacterium]
MLRAIGLYVIAFAFLLTELVCGDIVEMQDGTTVVCEILTVNEKAIELIEWNEKQPTVVLRSDVTHWAKVLDRERLNRLGDGRAESLLEYAEELSRFPNDGLATQWMTALAVAAGKRDQGRLADRALKLLAIQPVHAASKNEIVRLRQSIGLEPVPNTEQIAKVSLEQDQEDVWEFQNWLRQVRRGDVSLDRLSPAQISKFKSLHQRWKGVVGWSELLTVPDNPDEVFARELRILRLEQRVADSQREGDRSEKIETSQWQDVRFDQVQSNWDLPTWESVFQVNPELLSDAFNN